MTNEERDIIARYIARVGGAPAQQGFTGGSVPATTTPLPPVDQEADAFIADQFQRYPEARYRMTQTAFAQEAALAEAQNRIQRLQWELQQARQQAAQAAQAAQQPRGGGFFGGLFGGGQRAQAPGYQQAPQYQPPPPQYGQGYPPAMMQRGGSGFLGSALTTAAGVAGGVLAADAISSMFSGSHGGAFGGAVPGGETMNETVINNNYGTGAAPNDPWAGAGAAPDPSFQDNGQGNGGDPWAGGGQADAPAPDDFSGGGGADWGDQGGSSDDFI